MCVMCDDDRAVGWGPTVETTWKSTDGTGWTAFTSLQIDGQPYFLAYNQNESLIEFYRIVSDSQSPEQCWRMPWDAGWTTFMSFTNNSQNYVLNYNNAEGSAKIYPITPSTPLSDCAWSGSLEAGYSAFMPFVLDNECYFLAYDQNHDYLRIYPVASTSLQPEPPVQFPFSTGWTSFMHFTLDDKTCFLAYRSADHTVVTGTILHTDESISIELSQEYQIADWTPFRLARFESPTTHKTILFFLAYNNDSGEIKVYKISSDGQVVDPHIVTQHLAAGWQTVVPFHLNNQADVTNEDDDFVLLHKDYGAIGIASVKPPICEP